MNQRMRYLLLSFIAIMPASASVADTFLGIKYNVSIGKNEIVEIDTVTGQQTLLKQFEFPGGGFSAGTSFIDPKSGLLVMPDSSGAVLVYNRAENEISILPASAVSGLSALFPSLQSGGTDALISSGDSDTIQIGDGSILRSEADGTVHIGENSIVVSDEQVSASGNDEIYSSGGALQLGNTGDHKTVILGSLEVQGALEVPKPTQGSHAANKSYVDGMGAMMMAASQVSLTADPTANLSLGVGFGSMAGENAFAIGLAGTHQETSTRYSFTATYNDFTGTAAYGAGVSWSLR